MRRMYVARHRVCGHVAGASGDGERSMMENLVAALHAQGQYQWRVRVATDADVAALASGERCKLCRQDDPAEMAGTGPVAAGAAEAT